ncbi:MAG: four helix bundle protein [Bacteroidales bacterium]|nr:four helix bundle protein [Bacteroidales bacterium]
MNGPYRNLKVWNDSMYLVTKVYEVTSSFPASEIYGLTNQLRRAVVSIASNIAEGYGRSSNKDLVHFLYVSLGSSNELDTQIQIAYNLKYVTYESFKEIDVLNESINKMLHSLIYTREHL